jgi:hypothetical protein
MISCPCQHKLSPGLPKQAVPDFTKGPVVDIKNVEIIPEYKFIIKL